MLPVIAKLQRGEPITIVGIGSSIMELGGCLHGATKMVSTPRFGGETKASAHEPVALFLLRRRMRRRS